MVYQSRGNAHPACRGQDNQASGQERRSGKAAKKERHRRRVEWVARIRLPRGKSLPLVTFGPTGAQMDNSERGKERKVENKHPIHH